MCHNQFTHCFNAFTASMAVFVREQFCQDRRVGSVIAPCVSTLNLEASARSEVVRTKPSRLPPGRHLGGEGVHGFSMPVIMCRPHAGSAAALYWLLRGGGYFPYGGRKMSLDRLVAEARNRMGASREDRLRTTRERSVAFNKRVAHEFNAQEVSRELLAKTCSL